MGPSNAIGRSPAAHNSARADTHLYNVTLERIFVIVGWIREFPGCSAIAHAKSSFPLVIFSLPVLVARLVWEVRPSWSLTSKQHPLRFPLFIVFEQGDDPLRTDLSFTGEG